MNKAELIQVVGWLLAGSLSVLAVIVAARRAKAMEDTARAMEAGNRQERFRDAVAHLGHKQPSVRMGGVHALFQMAVEKENAKDKALRAAIADILCSHIRATTSKEKYKNKYKDKPSTEVQSIMELLFTTTRTRTEKKLDKFWRDLIPDLSEAWLRGLSLPAARWQEAKLRGAQFQGADLSKAQFQGADLSKAQFQGAELWEAQFQGAELEEAQFQGARLREAQFQGADLSKAQFQKAELWDAQFQGARLREAQFQRAFLRGAQFQGARLRGAQFQGTMLWRAQFQDANLDQAQFQGADLEGAQFQGTYLWRAQFQGADLEGAQFQGAFLHEAKFQGTDPWGAKFQGAQSELTREIVRWWEPGITFEERIREFRDTPGDLSEVVFCGGLSDEDVESIMNSIDAYRSIDEKQEIEAKLRAHVGKRQPDMEEKMIRYMEEKGVLGKYGEDEAEEWIREYRKAL